MLLFDLFTLVVVLFCIWVLRFSLQTLAETRQLVAVAETTEAERFLALVNADRASRGIPPVTAEEQLRLEEACRRFDERLCR